MNATLNNTSNIQQKYSLGRVLGRGVFGTVYASYEKEHDNKKVAIKVQKVDKITIHFIEQEQNILKQLRNAAYFVGLHGVAKVDKHYWLIFEHCEGGTALQLVKSLYLDNRRFSEEHLAYILHEVTKAIVYLHENKIVHRDIKASNVLFTHVGEVKLGDFGFAVKLQDKDDDKLWDRLGSPYWMAPEIVSITYHQSSCFYDKRVDVWSLGITAIELAQAKTPFGIMHPSLALFQIVKNPPPTLEIISSWSEEFRDFIGECLVKSFEYRPFIMELVEHPFLQKVPANSYHLGLEITALFKDLKRKPVDTGVPEVAIIGKYMKSSGNDQLEEILEEDLANVANLTESKIVDILEKRCEKDEYYTFIGDILISINPYRKLDIFGPEFHQKYCGKLKSDNAPHIYSIAEYAYQNAVHHGLPQYVIFTGESSSGKTSNYLHAIDHLYYIGKQHPVNDTRMKDALNLIQALTHATTPSNHNSTRCILKTTISFGPTGKLTASCFKVLGLEKWRTSSTDMDQKNFHIFYYVYDGLNSTGSLDKYNLHSRRDYRYLRVGNVDCDEMDRNCNEFKKICNCLRQFEFSDDDVTTFFCIITAVLCLGDLRFDEDPEDGAAVIKNEICVKYFAELLQIEAKMIRWALTNYCLTKNGDTVKRTNSANEARDARDVLANNLFCRLVDYIVAVLNNKLEVGKSIYGEKYCIQLVDFFGFECFKKNHLPQLFVNCFNEQLQYHYLQRVFSWEIQDIQSEEIDFEKFDYFDNRDTLNELLNKPHGMLSIIDDASKRNVGGKYIIDSLSNEPKSKISITESNEFSICHYTGTVPYVATEIPNKNRDFLPPEIIQTMRKSSNKIVKLLFSNSLNKTGNLCVDFGPIKSSKKPTALSRDVQFSQISNVRTSGMVYRHICLEMLKELLIGGSFAGTYFVRCIRPNVESNPNAFHKELVRHQARALLLTETAKLRQRGYSQRILFSDFLQRYKFLAFEFDENVDVTRDNCRLLLIRLKMEDWAIGKSKVFLKYYSEEYLARLYETQVKKIVKIQSILRGYLTKFKMRREKKEGRSQDLDKGNQDMTEDEAAGIIQKAYRNNIIKRRFSKGIEPLNQNKSKLVAYFARKWKNKTIFYVLMTYRASKLRAAFNFAQQVHLFNQNAFYQCLTIQEPIDLKCLDTRAVVHNWFSTSKPTVLKDHFALRDIPFFDTTHVPDPLTNAGLRITDEYWDSPYQQRGSSRRSPFKSNVDNNSFINIPYRRNPHEPLDALPLDDNPAIHYRIEQDRFSPSRGYQQRNTREIRSPNRLDQRSNKYTCSPISTNANFDISKSRSVTSIPASVDPIMELKTLTERCDSNSTDDPPFNFQGMLRKTNFQRDSLKRNTKSRNESFNASNDSVAKLTGPKSNYMDNRTVKVNHAAIVQSVSIELYPGMVLSGHEISV